MPLDDDLAQFEEFLSRTAFRFAGLRGEETDAAVRSVLGDLCRFLGTERSTFLEFSSDGRRFDSLYWWAAEGIPPTGNLEAERIPWYAGELRAGRVVALERLPDDLPADALGERQHVAQSGLKSNLAVPVNVGGRVVGGLAIGAFRQHRRWPEPLVRRVALFAQLIAGATHRRQQERALEESHAEIERLNRRLRRENVYLREEIRTERHADEIVGASPGMRRALEAVEQVAPLGSTVLLLGETGTGKELLARAIHDHSPRRDRALVRLNCAALPAGLVESELFGHERGAFTGASAARPGRFEVADMGTLFLDEVGDLPLEAQAKLLRVLQEGEFERLGSTRTRKVDVRIVAATHRDLRAAVGERRFREDLYYRLSVFPITIPPLRERPEDVEALVWFFVHRRQKELKRRIDTLAPGTLEALRRYPWPGNVRELENVIERALILSRGSVLEIDGTLLGGHSTARPPSAAGRDLDAVQRAHIISVLDESGWRINGPGNAADRLGMHPNTLRFRMKKLGIDRPGSRSGSGPQPPVP